MVTLWAIGLDYGAYEGQRPPLTFVRDKETALAIKKLFEQTYSTSIYVIEVPEFPEVRDAI